MTTTRPTLHKMSKKRVLSSNKSKVSGLPPTIASKLNDVSIQQPGQYVQCLMDPEKSSACSIPDESSYPTSLYTITQEIDVTAVVPAANLCHGIKVNLGADPKFFLENIASSSDGTYTYNSATAFDAATSVQANFQGARLVAASCRVEFSGNDANNQGLVLATALARSSTTSTLGLEDTASPVSLTAQRNSRETYVGPVKDGATCIYRPVDSASFRMQLTTNSTEVYGQFIFHFTKISTSAQITAYVTMHYEGLTKVVTSSSSNYQPEVTPCCNPFEMSLVSSLLPAFPTVYSALESRLGITSKNAGAIAGLVRKLAGGSTTAELIGAAFSAYGGAKRARS